MPGSSSEWPIATGGTLRPARAASHVGARAPAAARTCVGIDVATRGLMDGLITMLLFMGIGAIVGFAASSPMREVGLRSTHSAVVGLVGSLASFLGVLLWTDQFTTVFHMLLVPLLGAVGALVAVRLVARRRRPLS